MALFGKPKKEKIKSVKSDLDNDYETFDDDPFAEIEAGSSPDLNPSKRNPVINVVQGVGEGIVQTATSGAVLRDKIEKALPPGANYVFDTVDKTASGVRKLYDDSVKEMRPHVKDLTKKIDKLVPAQAQSLKKLTSKVAGFFDDGASNYNGPSKEEMEDNTIAGALNSVFQVLSSNFMHPLLVNSSLVNIPSLSLTMPTAYCMKSAYCFLTLLDSLRSRACTIS
jgi:hypothetical protein